ncbi:hypothetical protein Tco_1083665 [Tanacetum coccineum]
MQKERVAQEEASNAALIAEFDDVQARMDADALLAARLLEEEREQFSIDEQARFLVETIAERKREQKWINDFVPMDSEMVKDNEKNDDYSKKQTESRDDIAINVESLATKYPIVDWKTRILTENMMYYQISRADGSSKNYKIFSEMLDDFDRQYMVDLYSLVKKRYEIISPEGYDKLLWGDLITLFESIAIHMMVEKKYTLTQEMLLRMLNRRLKVDHESTMAFELIRFIKAQLESEEVFGYILLMIKIQVMKKLDD